MKIRNYRYILVIGLVLLTMFTLFTSFTDVSAETEMTKYCTQPPFLGSSTQPNILLMLDNSGSMNCIAYTSDYNPNQFNSLRYYGYFEPSTLYYYDTAVTPNRWIPVDRYSPAKTLLSGTSANPVAKGDFLNWAAMSRLDVSKKILIGGRASMPNATNTSTYNINDRTSTDPTTDPVLLYSESNPDNGNGCNSTFKNYDTITDFGDTFASPTLIYPYVGDFRYTLATTGSTTPSGPKSGASYPNGNLGRLIISYNGTLVQPKMYPTSNYSTATATAYTFPTTNWVASSGNAWQTVDEATANQTDYITNQNSATALAMFGYTPPAAGAFTITSVSVTVYARKYGTSNVYLQGQLRTQGSSPEKVTASPGTVTLSTTWATYTFTWATNPETGAAWQWSDFTGAGVGSVLSFGIKGFITSTASPANPTTTNYPRVSQVYMQINGTAPGGTYNVIADQGSTPAAGVLDALSSQVRFGYSNYNLNSSSSNNAGHIVDYIGFNQVPNIINSLSDINGTTYTPLAETLYEIVRYFRQDNAYFAQTSPSVSTYDYVLGCNGATVASSTCGASAVPNSRDPYLFDFTDLTPDGYVPCAKSFVLFITDGEPTNDTSVPAISGITGTDLVAVAKWGRTVDQRPGADTDIPTVWRKSLPGDQRIVVYPVYLFGSGSTLLKDASIQGGFDDLNSDNIPNCTTNAKECYRDSNGDGEVGVPNTTFTAGPYNGQGTGVCSNSSSTHCTANSTCTALVPSNPDAVCNFDDPITYYEGGDGYQLEESIINAINAIAARTASGTAASVLASGEGSGANLVQSIFYPKRSFVGTTEVSWVGTLSNMWYYIDPRLGGSSIREDTIQDRALKLTQDRIVEYTFNSTTNQTGMNLFADSDGNGVKDGAAVATADMDTLKYLWEAGRLLFQRTAGDENPGSLYASTARTIFTNTNDDSTLDVFAVSNAATLKPLVGFGSYSGTADTQNLIRYMRGNDSVSIDLTGDGIYDAIRSRGTTVNISGIGNVTNVWKLGDTINSTPKLVSWTPLHKFDKTYLDNTYTQFYSSAGYKNRGMVFVGANDGMLHAFKLGLLGIYNEADRKATLGKYCSTTTTKGCSSDSDCPAAETCLTDSNIGKEAWAFIPKNSLPYLLYQAKADYCHLYYIDATPTIFDSSIEAPGVHDGDYWTQTKTSSSWRTVLIGGMRYGGACRSNGTSCSECVTTPISGNSVGLSSYFALDVTDPESPSLLWEYASSALGLSSTGPAIVRISAKNNCSVTTAQSCDYDGACPSGETCLQDGTKNGRWFVVVGSGPSGYVSPTSRQFTAVTEHGIPVAGKGKIMLHVLDLKTGALVQAIDAGEDSAFAGSFTNATIDIDNDYSDDALYFGFSARNTLGTTATAQAGSTATTIKLASGASATNGFYNGKFIHRTDGIHETKLIINYDGATKIATMDSSWQLTPTAATQYNILDGWNTGGVKRLFTKESINPADWVVSDVIRTTGPVTAAVSKLLNVNDHMLRLYFGTGRYFYKIGQIVDDATTARRIYGVKDPCIIASGVDTACTTTVSEGSLGAADGSTNTDGSTDIYGNVNTLGSSDSDGWYIPLQEDFGTNAAERVITDPLATQIGAVFFTTTKPSNDICTFGGKSYIWAVRYDTGGTVPAGTLKGKAMIQLSTGAIQEVNLASAFDAQGNRRTSITMQGLPPMDQSLNVPIAPKPIAKVLHMQKK